MRPAWLLVAASCGRIAFDVPGDAGEVVPSDQIVIHVLSDQAIGVAVGEPVVGAAVLDSRGERTMTDDTGTARIMATSPLRVDIVAAWGSGTRFYTLIDVPPGTAVHVGGHADGSTRGIEQLTLPAHAGVAQYAPRMREQCDDQPAFYGGAMLGIQYRKECDGNTVHVEALALEPQPGPIYWLSGQNITLGSPATVTGTWDTPKQCTVTVGNIQAAATDAGAYLYRTVDNGAGLALVSLDSFASVLGGAATINVTGGQIADALRIQLDGSLGPNYNTHSTKYFAIDGASTQAVSAQAFLPLYSGLTPDVLGATWGPATAANTIYTADYSLPGIRWTAIVPPGSRAVTFPALPSDLAARAPTTAPTLATLFTYQGTGLDAPFAIDPILEAGLGKHLPTFASIDYTLF